jgi:hypothetical protein
MKSGLLRFQSSIAVAATAIAKRQMKANPEGVAQWVRSALSGVEAPRAASTPATSRDERFAIKISQGFSEISKSLESLETIAKLARRSPAASSGIDPAAQLRLLMEAWYHEVYILWTRCDSFTSIVTRAYKHDERGDDIRARMNELQAAVKRALSPVITVRGAHVHETRYNDFELSRLGTLSILAPGDHRFERIRRAALRDVRRTKVQWLQQRNSEVQKLLDVFFDQLHPIVFVRKGKLRYPGTPRPATVNSSGRKG